MFGCWEHQGTPQINWRGSCVRLPCFALAKYGIDGWMDGWMDRQIDRLDRLDRLIRQIDRQIDRQIIDRWIDWMDGQKDRYTDGWMDGWIDCFLMPSLQIISLLQRAFRQPYPFNHIQPSAELQSIQSPSDEYHISGSRKVSQPLGVPSGKLT